MKNHTTQERSGHDMGYERRWRSVNETQPTHHNKRPCPPNVQFDLDVCFTKETYCGADTMGSKIRNRV